MNQINNNLKFPKKSHRKKINIPSESTDLAEFMGIVLGDGGINNEWQIVISLNAISDANYAIYVKSLIEKLFQTEIVLKKRPTENTLKLVGSSMSLVDFLIEKGAVRGNKVKQEINIPLWISENREYKKTFVKGLIDTDGCVYIHNHKVKNKLYNNLGLCFTNFSKKLTSSVSGILTEFEIKNHITNHGRRIYSYGQNAIENYLKIFGTSNPRIYNKYQTWWDVRVV